jgi:colanic acid biosynthesis glycosyl transferase WcaI
MASFLFLTQYFAPEVGAAPIRLLEVASALRARGHAVTVVTAMPSHPRGRVFDAYRRKLYMRERVSGVPVVRTWVYAASGKSVAPRLLNYASFMISSWLGCLSTQVPDFVFVESPPLFLGITAYLYARLRRVPYILNVSDLWPDSARALGVLDNDRLFKLNEQLEAFLYRHAFRINVVTQPIADILVGKKAVPHHKILSLPNGVNLSRFDSAPEHRECDGPPLFSYVGTHGQVQDLDVILDAAHIVRDEARFLLVGDGSDKARLVDRARTLGLRNVTFCDSRPFEEVPGILAASRAALVTVRSGDVFRTVRPAKLFPAMASATPVIYAGDDEGSVLVEQSGCGVAVAPGDGHAMAMAVRRLAADPELARRLGAKGRAAVERDYNWDVIVDRWLSDLGVAGT